jgi:hypothetical protein
MPFPFLMSQRGPWENTNRGCKKNNKQCIFFYGRDSSSKHAFVETLFEVWWDKKGGIWNKYLAIGLLKAEPDKKNSTTKDI